MRRFASPLVTFRVGRRCDRHGRCRLNANVYASQHAAHALELAV